MNTTGIIFVFLDADGRYVMRDEIGILAPAPGKHIATILARIVLERLANREVTIDQLLGEWRQMQ